ncbi:hypothetical protein CKO31_12760 [Thiohalocapsa halophila]|uniref:Uncharacterized protein n=1 Tax=Thiohalocapsa halophila TaxID=69359 RepID=A0ABS1CJC7_9GAMM|nr:hypothetical protein [Thiohalocapsa halophila]MBK1631599.1 hypothetical protein [Thiohalocapsa halophila]
MRYAARRTWPEKIKAWEYISEAEDMEAFALMFAEDKQLAADTEFVVIEKAGAESEIEFFKVSRTEPYALIAAEPRVESASNPAPAPAQAQKTSSGGGLGFGRQGQPMDGGAEAIAGVWRAMFSNALFFGKVGATAMLIFVSAVFMAKWWFNAW